MRAEDNGDFVYEVDTRGFRPDELRVDIDENSIIVQGEHRKDSAGLSIFFI
jgi:HSP20 family molecular chaperone IbpA